METAYTPGVTFIDDADFLRLTGRPEIEGATLNRRLMRRMACFTCEASRAPAVTATLHDRRTIALCQSCLLVPAHVATFVEVFLADRRAAVSAKGYAACTPLSPDNDATSCERVQR
jgi:hypothetical protein